VGIQGVPEDSWSAPGLRVLRWGVVAMQVSVVLLTTGLGIGVAETSSGAPAAASSAIQQIRDGSRPAHRAFLDEHCVMCHNGRLHTAGLALDTVDLGDVGHEAAIWERVVRKLRADAMPPAGRPRPDPTARQALVSWLEAELDREATDNPDPGRPAIHRLNRTEYVNVIRDLLGLEIDGRSLLPGDNADVHGFDNNADILSVSPVLMERYLAAARKISRLVVGRATTPDFHQHRVHKWMVQEDRMSEDLPFGSRGGVAVPYFFPADGEYEIQVELQRTGNQHIKGLGAAHQLEIRLDGALVQRFTIGGGEWIGQAPPESYSGNINVGLAWEDYSHNMDGALLAQVPVQAGRHVVGVSFVGHRWQLEGIIVTQPQVGVSQSRNEIPDGNPSVASVTIGGPFNAAGAGKETVPRRRVFVCQPGILDEEEPCARDILSTLARRAYRRPVVEADVETLMRFFAIGREDGSFEAGIQLALERLLVSPSFLFRVEAEPPPATTGAYRISGLELASRLSFFLWSSMPDDTLLEAAERGALADPAEREAQVRRMLGDPRARALVDNFVGQWLAVRNLRDVVPDSDLFPEFDENLRLAFQRETQLFMESMLRENRRLTDLLDADYTFVNERLARHYGIPNVYGNRFRRVPVANGQRGGLLGHGSVLTVTSYPNRTSPVLRGKWLLENFFGAPPPAPPPDIPALEENTATRAPRSVRARLEEHRRQPACATCHARMDPLGFALERYDPIGAWRGTDAGVPIDTVATLPDGTQFEGHAGLRQLLLDRHELFAQTVTEKLLTYALGRELEHYDAPVVRGILRAAAADEYRWSSMILGIVESLPFQMRRAGS
jgi:mono/diheme cytochrome c family protein